MDEALKRRLTGALVVIVALFIVSLLLPHPGTVPSDNDNKRVTLDLSGKDEGTTPAPVTSTPVPPVIAAPSGDKPASKPEETLASNASAATPPEETPSPAVLPSEPAIDDEPAPTKPASPPAATPAAPVAKPAKPAPPKPAEKPPAKVEPKAASAAAVAPAKAPAVVAKPSAPVSAKTHWFVQVGAFSDVDNAHQVLDKLGAQGLKGLIAPMDSGKGTRYRARLGPFGTREQAKAAQDRIARLGYAGTALVED